MSNENKVVTGKVRFCYANVFTPKQNDQGKEVYSISLVIPKSDDATFKAIMDAVEQAYKDGAKVLQDKKGNVPAFDQIKLPLRDGDTDREGDEVYAGSYFLNASSMYKPGIIDADKNIIMNQDDFYSGCYGRASIVFYAYKSKGNVGIACGLRNLQKLEDGEKLGGVASALEDFAD